MGDAKEEFNLGEVEFCKSGANPNPNPEPSDGPEVAEAASTATQLSTVKNGACGTSTEEREAKKGEFMEMHRLKLLLMQENAS